LVNAYIVISASRCGRVVNGFNFEARTQNHKPVPDIHFWSPIYTWKPIYLVRQDTAFNFMPRLI